MGVSKDYPIINSPPMMEYQFKNGNKIFFIINLYRLENP